MEGEKILTGQELLNTLHNQDWKILYPKLEAYAIFAYKKYGINSEVGISGNEPKDFLQKAIELIFLEKRKWNVITYPEIFDFITGVINSLISNFLKLKKSIKTIKEFDALLLHEEENEDGIDGVDGYLVAKEMYDIIQSELDGDDEAIVVLECMGDGLLKPQDISDDLGIEINELYNIIKRIRRARERALLKIVKS